MSEDISPEAVDMLSNIIEAMIDMMTPEEEAGATLLDLAERQRADSKKGTAQHLTKILTEIFTEQQAERHRWKEQLEKHEIALATAIERTESLNRARERIEALRRQLIEEAALFQAERHRLEWQRDKAARKAGIDISELNEAYEEWKR